MTNKSLYAIAFILLIGATALAFNHTADLSDIKGYDWEESIDYLVANDIVDGYDDGTYRPNQTINRAEFSKIVMTGFYLPQYIESFENDCFPDVPTGAWFEKYVCMAKSEGIIDGYPDGTFKPANEINQAEALKIILKIAYEEVDSLKSAGEWYQVFLDEAEDLGMFYFSAENNPAAHALTRGQMAYFIAWTLDDEGFDQIAPEDFSDDYQFQDEFGFEAMTPDDCYEDEYYDAQDQTCYLDDATSNNDTDYTDYLDKGSPTRHADSDSNLNLLVRYTIEGDNLTIKSGQENPAARMIWEHFIKLVPTAHRSAFAEFGIHHSPDDDTLAHVEPLDERDLSQWELVVNTAELLNEDDTVKDWKEFNLTMVHEFAHVMTLNDTQIQADTSAHACKPAFHTGEGCAYKHAFINLYVKKFWPKKDREIVRSGEDEYDGFGSDLYEQSPTNFITEYAATNPGEDIAESFAYFVYGPKPTNNDLGKNKKITFFYNFPSLVTLRNNIRRALKN